MLDKNTTEAALLFLNIKVGTLDESARRSAIQATYEPLADRDYPP